MGFGVCFLWDLVTGGWIFSLGCLFVWEKERRGEEIFFFGILRKKLIERMEWFFFQFGFWDKELQGKEFQIGDEGIVFMRDCGIWDLGGMRFR